MLKKKNTKPTNNTTIWTYFHIDQISIVYPDSLEFLNVAKSESPH